MPIYEYQCKACQHQFEAIQAFNEAPLKKCTECGKAKLTKLVSAPSFQLKGSGWYETDFKKSGKPTIATSADSSATNGSDAKTNRDNSAADNKNSNETKSDKDKTSKNEEKVAKTKSTTEN